MDESYFLKNKNIIDDRNIKIDVRISKIQERFQTLIEESHGFLKYSDIEELEDIEDLTYQAAKYGVSSILVMLYVERKDLILKYAIKLLCTAARYGQVDILKYLIKSDISLNKNHKKLLLYSAIQYGQLGTLRYLMESKELNIDQIHNVNYKILYIAVKCGELGILRYLLQIKQLEIHYKYKNNISLLHVAAKYGKLSLIKCLIEEYQIDVNQKDDENNTVFHWVAYSGKLDSLKYLLNHSSIIPNLQNKNGETPLHIAIDNGKLSMARYFIERVTLNLNEKNHYQNTILHIATQKGWLTGIQYLLKHCPINSYEKNSAGNMPIHIAAQNGDLSILQYFIQKNIDIHQPNDEGDTVLHIATYMGHLPLLQYLIEQQHMAINIKNKKGDALLHIAAHRGFLPILVYLIEERTTDEGQPTDIYQLNKKGHHALNIAICQGQIHIVRYLIEQQKMNPYEKDNQDNTFLHYAAQFGQGHIIKYLIENQNLDINQKNKQGYNVLHALIVYENDENKLKIARYLIKKRHMNIYEQNIYNIYKNRDEGMDDGIIEESDEKKYTCMTLIHLAAQFNALPIMHYLIEHHTMDYDSSMLIISQAEKERGITKKELKSHLKRLDIQPNLIEQQENDFAKSLDLFAQAVAKKPTRFVLNNSTPIEIAVRHGNFILLEYLIKERHLEPASYRLIHIAVEFKQIFILNYLIFQCKLDINQTLSKWDSTTPLHIAIYKRDLKFLKFMLSMYQVELTYELLEVAVRGGDLSIVKFLMLKISLSKSNISDLGCLLHVAAEYGHLNIVQYFIEEWKMDVNLKNLEGKTVLDVVIQNQELIILQYIIEKKIEFKYDWGWTILHIAARYGGISVIKYLLENQAVDINKKDNRGNTAYQVALINKQYREAAYLWTCFKDIDRLNYDLKSSSLSQWKRMFCLFGAENSVLPETFDSILKGSSLDFTQLGPAGAN